MKVNTDESKLNSDIGRWMQMNENNAGKFRLLQITADTDGGRKVEDKKPDECYKSNSNSVDTDDFRIA